MVRGVVEVIAGGVREEGAHREDGERPGEEREVALEVEEVDLSSQEVVHGEALEVRREAHRGLVVGSVVEARVWTIGSTIVTRSVDYVASLAFGGSGAILS